MSKWHDRAHGPPMMFSVLLGVTAASIAGFVELLRQGSGTWAVVGMIATSALALAGILASLLLAAFIDQLKKNLR